MFYCAQHMNLSVNNIRFGWGKYKHWNNDIDIKWNIASNQSRTQEIPSLSIAMDALYNAWKAHLVSHWPCTDNGNDSSVNVKAIKYNDITMCISSLANWKLTFQSKLFLYAHVIFPPRHLSNSSRYVIRSEIDKSLDFGLNRPINKCLSSFI